MLASFVALATLAGAAHAQTYSVQIDGGRPDLGRIVSAAHGDTIFRIAASSGQISRISGNGVRLSGGSSRTKVTISCGNQGSCNNRKPYIRIGAFGSPTGRAGPLSAFTVSMGTAQLDEPVTGSDTLDFRLKPIGKNQSKTFYVGADLPIRPNGSAGLTGDARSDFYVGLGLEPTEAAAYDTGAAEAVVYRTITLTKHADLKFGRIVRPQSGSGRVDIDPASGARSTVNAVGLPAPSTTAARYTVTGEGGRSVSVDIPPSFSMSGPNGSVTVTTATTADTSPLLNSTMGSSGIYTFNVGGGFPLSASTPTGAYSGYFSVTVAYN